MDNTISRYFDLVEEHPQLFRQRRRRKLILDRTDLERWSSQNNIQVGVLAETPFFLFLNDLVRIDDREPHTYSRLISKKSLAGQNSVVVLPIIRSNLVILVSQERHATGEQMLELPRGFAEPGQNETVQAVEELATETGYKGTPVFLGTSYTDTGATDNKVSFYLIEVTERGDSKPEVTEDIDKIIEMPLREVRDQVGAGRILDGYTIQAIAMYDRYRRLVGTVTSTNDNAR